MDYAYRFGHPRRIYLNVTNRCTNRCAFCVRYACEGLGGAQLWAGDDALGRDEEPDLDALYAAVRELRGPDDQDEIIWCGFGEPTFRMDLIEGAAGFLRRGGAHVRLDTNGHAAIINGEPAEVLASTLAEAIDAVSVSLNAPAPERYAQLCQPTGEDLDPDVTSPPADPGEYWQATVDFIRAMSATPVHVTVSVVGSVLGSDEVEESRRLALRLGAAGFRIR